MKLLIARWLYWLKGLFEDPVEHFKALGVGKDDRILEIGCAVGYHTLPLARIASQGKVYAVDVWEQALSYLRRSTASMGNVEIIHRSAGDLAFDPTSVDKIICFDTLHEVPSPGEALAKWACLLTYDGKLLYRDPTISAEELVILSNYRFRHVDRVRGVDVFVRAGC